MNRICLPIFALILVSPAFAADAPAKTSRPGLAGGYSPAEIDSDVRTVAEFAVKTQAESTGRPLRLIKILKAERQVVAGLNYRLEIVIADGSKRLKAGAVVWKKLDGSLALTSWENPAGGKASTFRRNEFMIPSQFPEHAEEKMHMVRERLALCFVPR